MLCMLSVKLRGISWASPGLSVSDTIPVLKTDTLTKTRLFTLGLFSCMLENYLVNTCVCFGAEMFLKIILASWSCFDRIYKGVCPT